MTYTRSRLAAVVGVTALLMGVALPTAASASARYFSGDPCTVTAPTPQEPDINSHVDSITFTGSGQTRTAHVVASGFEPNDQINTYNWSLTCDPDNDRSPGPSGKSNAQGAVTIDVPVRAGHLDYVHFDHSRGTQGVTLEVWPDDREGETPAPGPAAPTVATAAASGGRTTITVSGEDGAQFSVRNQDGRVVAGGLLARGSATVLVASGSNERVLTATQTVGGEESAAASIRLSAGIGSSTPAQTKSTGVGHTTPFTADYRVAATPGAVVTFIGESGEVQAVRRVGPTGIVEILGISRFQAGLGAFITQTLDGATSVPEKSEDIPFTG